MSYHPDGRRAERIATEREVGAYLRRTAEAASGGERDVLLDAAAEFSSGNQCSRCAETYRRARRDIDLWPPGSGEHLRHVGVTLRRAEMGDATARAEIAAAASPLDLNGRTLGGVEPRTDAVASLARAALTLRSDAVLTLSERDSTRRRSEIRRLAIADLDMALAALGLAPPEAICTACSGKSWVGPYSAPVACDACAGSGMAYPTAEIST